MACWPALTSVAKATSSSKADAGSALPEPRAGCDGVIFMNFRGRSSASRALTRAFVEPGFSGLPVARQVQLAGFVMLTQYAADIPAPAPIRRHPLDNVLGEYLQAGQTQLRIARDQKKYARQ